MLGPNNCSESLGCVVTYANEAWQVYCADDERACRAVEDNITACEWNGHQEGGIQLLFKLTMFSALDFCYYYVYLNARLFD